QGCQGLDRLVVRKPRSFLREADHLDLNDGLIVVGLQRRADGADLNELCDLDLVGVGVEAEHEVRREVLLENREAAGPSALGRMKHAGSRRIEEHALIEMRYAADMGYGECACLIQPRFDSSSHRARPPGIWSPADVIAVDCTTQ